MPIATPEQYISMIDAARGEGYAFPAINVTSSETFNAAVRGLSEARSDGIVQITTSAAEYLSGRAYDMAVGARAFAAFAHEAAATAPTLIALHTDHCPPEHVDRFLRPLLAESRSRRDRGQGPLFNSHMFDGSSLALADNLRIASDLLREANELGVLLELEIGTVGGEEDGIDNSSVSRERLYSSAKDALAVAHELGLGERGRYLLAATFGNVHGHYAPGNVVLRPELLGELQRAIGKARGFDFVFHGGSGSTREEVEKAIANGVVKVNVDTDMQYAFTLAIEDHLYDNADLDTGPGVDKRIYDPRAWGREAEHAMADKVVEIAMSLGSAGRTHARH